MAGSSARRVLQAPAAWSDWGLAAALLVIAEVDVWWPEAAVWGDDPVPGPAWVNAILLGGLAVVVAWRRMAPLAATAFASACVVAQAIISGDPPIGLLVAAPVLLLAYAVAAHASRGGAWLGIGCLAVATAVHDGIDVHTSAELEDASWWWLLIVATWLGGRYVGTRRRARDTQALARRREEASVRAEQEAVAAERLRIAGELHDVVAHNISVVALQAGAALELLDRSPDRARAPLTAIEETAQHTLTEMGAMVGILRSAGDPAPVGLGALPALADRVTAAGLAVRMDVGPLSELSPGVDLSAYRIVQEAVTNALRHATGATEVEVVIRQHGDDVLLRVADDGQIPDVGQGDSVTEDSGGHGLVGMRERAAAFGGHLHAGPAWGGGFVVQARLPVTGPAGG
jgi:signal transduction histidine kinase